MNAENLVRILVVEDNPMDQELLFREMHKASLSDGVLFLSDPRSALELLEGEQGATIRRDLMAILLDVNLPHMTGIDLLRRLRIMDGLESIPVLIMTSLRHPEIIAASRELNAMGCLEKPVKSFDLLQMLSPVSVE